ncbi:MAG: hypothetical protein PGMFKBFP_03261 [Anaerolineales bacterium]|nr:hypothetical protein [Anaerolineales bacterium]
MEETDPPPFRVSAPSLTIEVHPAETAGLVVPVFRINAEAAALVQVAVEEALWVMAPAVTVTVPLFVAARPVPRASIRSKVKFAVAGNTTDPAINARRVPLPMEPAPFTVMVPALFKFSHPVPSQVPSSVTEVPMTMRDFPPSLRMPPLSMVSPSIVSTAVSVGSFGVAAASGIVTVSVVLGMLPPHPVQFEASLQAEPFAPVHAQS